MAKGFFGVLFSEESGFIMRINYLRYFGSFAPASLDASDSARIFAVKEVLRETATALIRIVEEYRRNENDLYRRFWQHINCEKDVLCLNLDLKQIRSLEQDLGAMLCVAQRFHSTRISNYGCIFSTTPDKLRRLYSALQFLDIAEPITLFHG